MSQKYSNVVCTSGRSLLRRYNAFGAWALNRPYFHFPRANPESAAGQTEDSALRQWCDDCDSLDLSAAAGRPKAVSAEYSLLTALGDAGLLTDQPRVVLIHAATLGGRCVTHLLHRILRRDFDANVVTREVEELDVDRRDVLQRGFGRFMEAVARELEGRTTRDTCFAALGGYKFMTSLGYLAGAYMGFPTAYLHGDHQALHLIPAIPIQLPHEKLRGVAPVMRRLRHLGSWVELTDGQRRLIDEHSYLFDQIDELVTVNAFGQFLMGRARNRILFDTRLHVGPEVSKAYSDHRSERRFVLQQLIELGKALEAGGGPLKLPRRTFQHELEFNLRPKPDFHLYRDPAAHGQHVFRATYEYNHVDNELFVPYIWTDHNLYEREAPSGVGLYRQESMKWFDWSEAAYAEPA